MPEREATTTSKPNGTSLIAIIGTVATLIGAVVGLLGVFHTLGWIGTENSQPAPAAIVVQNGPSTADMAAFQTQMAALQTQLRAVQAQLVSNSTKASAMPRPESVAASAAAATWQLSSAAESAEVVDQMVSRLQSLWTQMTPETQNAEFEIIKNEIEKLSQMQRAMSNELETLDELAKMPIRKIKA